MRWCTDRLKIQPTSRYILENVSKHGAAIVLLGVRKDESNSRMKSIDKFQNLKDSNLTPHSSLPGAFIYRPIVDMSLDDVWEVLGLGQSSRNFGPFLNSLNICKDSPIEIKYFEVYNDASQ